MKNYLNSLLSLFLLGFMIFSCKPAQDAATFYDYEVKCMGTGTDGTQLIKVYSYGKNNEDAIEQAKKNAVRAVIFKGISTGTGGCMRPALATEPGTDEKYKEYFNNFFKDGGRYLNYVNISSDGTINPNDRMKVGNRYKVGIVVSVAHAALRKELEKEGIVKKLGQGF